MSDDEVLHDEEPGLHTEDRPDQMAARKRDKLAAAVRLSIRELLNEKGIQELLRTRVQKELKGEMDMEITPTVLRIAAAHGNARKGGESKRGAGATSSLNVFVGMNDWSPDELLAYAMTGRLPEHVKAAKQIGNGRKG